MRRLAPRPIAVALDSALPGARPAGLLPEVQGLWPEVAGEALAAWTSPISEREGIVTVACESSVWAQELELMGGDLRERLNTRLGGGTVGRLRFVVGSGAKQR